MEKVLIGIVTYDGKNYCFKEFAKFLHSISYPNIEILFVDNSKWDYNKKMIENAGFKAIWLRKGTTEQHIMANCNEYLRWYALTNNFTHLLNLESDVFPRPNFLELLLSYEVPVIGLPYFIGQSFMSYLLQFDKETAGFNRQLIPMANSKSFFLYNGKLKRAMQIGLGCLLMSKSVLKRIKFTISDKAPMYHADSSLHLQFQQLNIPVYLCSDYICIHDNKVHNVLYVNETHARAAKYKDFRGNIA
jgi:GT2 family glycosyltransferase